MWFPWQRRETPAPPVGEIITIGEQRLGIVDFGTELSRHLRRQIHKNILEHGEAFKSGDIFGPACLPVLGAGSAAASSLLAGNVFLATANPASLMQIGAGVGAAVIGPGGTIVGQAPFIAMGGAIMPIIAPVMLFMTVSAMMISARLDQIQVSLEQLAAAVEQLLIREIAGDYGILRNAIERLRDISDEFNECGRFTEEMRIRMALLEKDIDILHHKYDVLATRPVGNMVGANLAASDLDLFTLSSLADIQVDRLRLRLALQDNPEDITRRVSVLNSKIGRYEKSFRGLLENHAVKQFQEELQESVNRAGLLKKIFALKKFKKKKAAIKQVGAIRDERIAPTLKTIAGWLEDLALGKDVGQTQCVWFYRENHGKGDLKAYCTSDWQLLTQPQEESTP